ncbi:MAG: T9SS type A sorting domain-containing protein, partial [Bacteroidota bacterium]|nr:T9SS type A sorting domain-containing protein [Bacteroidota bacterium]
LKQIDADGKFEYSKMVEVSLGLPWTYKLSQNYPNPFNPSTKIDFSVPETGFYKLKVYNLAGQEVATLIEKEFAPGNYSVDFNGKHLPSGMYFYRLLGENVNIVKKMLLVK